MKYYEKTIDSREIFKGKIVKLRLDKVELPNGDVSSREIIEHPGAVAVVAITPDNKVLLVKQYRKACEQELLEIPAGKLESGEEPLSAVLRELEEETGYRAGNAKKLLSFYTSPGFANELIHIYLAEELTISKQSTDDDEFLTVHQFSWEEINQLIQNGDLKDAKTITGLLMVMAHKGVQV